MQQFGTILFPRQHLVKGLVYDFPTLLKIMFDVHDV